MKVKSYPPLVITTAVLPSDVPYLTMTDSNRRVEKYLEGIDEWLRKIPNLQIIICDGTGYDWLPEIMKQYGDSQIECLTFFNDIDAVKRFGKGYGEVQILNYAVDHSKFLKKTKHFMKITGKYWVENIHVFSTSELFSDFKFKSAFKIKNWTLLYVNSAFFVCSIYAYRKYLYDSFRLVNDHIGNDLEHVLGKILVENKIKNYQFEHLPAICGWSGTGDHSFNLGSKSLKDKFREIKYLILSWIL